MMSEHTSDRPLLVITGAAGRIGSFYRRWLRAPAPSPATSGAGDAGGVDRRPWRVRLVDVREPTDVDPADEVLSGAAAGDLADLDVARRAVTGAHTVLHLAADPSPRADFYASLL